MNSRPESDRATTTRSHLGSESNGAKKHRPCHGTYHVTINMPQIHCAINFSVHQPCMMPTFFLEDLLPLFFFHSGIIVTRACSWIPWTATLNLEPLQCGTRAYMSVTVGVGFVPDFIHIHTYAQTFFPFARWTIGTIGVTLGLNSTLRTTSWG
jgi:hypothetical protein